MAFKYTVEVFPFKDPKGPKKAFASVLVDGVMEIRGFSIVDTGKGAFVGVPQRKGVDKQNPGKEKWFDDVVFHEDVDPQNGIFKGPVFKEIEQAMIAAYNSKVGGNSRGNAAAANSSAPTQTKNVKPSASFNYDDERAW